MINFFRKIRQNLLSEGKTGKYLKYAIGEIMLVVVGILIADAVGIGVVIFFMSINWTLLLTERKFKLVKPKLWRF